MSDVNCLRVHATAVRRRAKTKTYSCPPNPERPDNSMTTSAMETIRVMRITRHKRQIFLFLVAILVPAGVLIGLGGRILYQDRELAIKRAVDQRSAAVEQLRRELSSRLEAIKLQELNPRNGDRLRALNREMVTIVQHEQRRRGRSGSPGG